MHVQFGSEAGNLEVNIASGALIHLYNGGPYQLIVCHFFIGICAYMGREWERAEIFFSIYY